MLLYDPHFLSLKYYAWSEIDVVPTSGHRQMAPTRDLDHMFLPVPDLDVKEFGYMSVARPDSPILLYEIGQSLSQPERDICRQLNLMSARTRRKGEDVEGSEWPAKQVNEVFWLYIDLSVLRNLVLDMPPSMWKLGTRPPSLPPWPFPPRRLTPLPVFTDKRTEWIAHWTDIHKIYLCHFGFSIHGSTRESWAYMQLCGQQEDQTAPLYFDFRARTPPPPPPRRTFDIPV